MLECRSLSGLHHWLFFFFMLWKTGRGIISKLASHTIHKVILPVCALRTPWFKFCTPLAERKCLTFHYWALVIFTCSGDRKWPERKLSYPLEGILNLNTTLAPAKIKKIHEPFKSHHESCEGCKYTVLIWNILCLGSEVLTRRGKPMSYFALPIAVPEIRCSLQW